MQSKLQTLDTPQVPNLPVPDAQYNKPTADQHNGLLRTFMLKLAASLRTLFGPNGGQYIECPYGLFFNTASQTFAAANTAYAINFNSTYLENGLRRPVTGTVNRIYAVVGGVYNFQYSGQLISTNASSKEVRIWIYRSGNGDIGYSTRVYTLSQNNEYQTIDWNFDIDMQPGQYVLLRISTTDTTVSLVSSAAGVTGTEVPSSVLTVNFISPLPNTLPTPP